MKRRAAVVVFAALAAISLCLAPADATGRHHRGHGKVLVVDNEHRHRSCLGTRKPFQTIQGAVDVARPGATIWVCPGVYEEMVKVEKPRLTLKGANAGRDATWSGRHRESVVRHPEPEATQATVQLLADDITWDGFTIVGNAGAQNGPGMATSERHSGYLIRDTIFVDNGVGLDLGASGEDLSYVCRNRFVANNEVEPGGGYGVFSERGAQKVLIIYNRFQDHNGAAIFFADRGKRQRDLLVDHNKSVDDLSFATLYNTSRGRVTSNSATPRVGDKGFPGPTSAIFIGARNDRVLVHKNRVHAASGNGIDVSPSAEPHQGRGAAPPTNITVSRNTAEHAELAGLHMAKDTAGVVVTGNTALDNGDENGEWDCLDDSTGSATAGTVNTWQGNVGRKAKPATICSPPVPDDTPVHDGKHHHRKHKKKHKQDPCVCTRHHPRAI